LATGRLAKITQKKIANVFFQKLSNEYLPKDLMIYTKDYITKVQSSQKLIYLCMFCILCRYREEIFPSDLRLWSWKSQGKGN